MVVDWRGKGGGKVYLDKISKAILEAYAHRKNLSISQLSAIANASPFDFLEPISVLREKKYLRIESNHATTKEMNADAPISFDTPLEITFQGRAALEEDNRLSKEKRNAWIRYIITTAIAVVALIVSIVSIALQFR